MSEFDYKTRCAGIPEINIPLCKETVDRCNGQSDELKPTCHYYIDECVQGLRNGNSFFEFKTATAGILKYRSAAACFAAGPSITELFGPQPDISKKSAEERVIAYLSPDAEDPDSACLDAGAPRSKVFKECSVLAAKCARKAGEQYRLPFGNIELAYDTQEKCIQNVASVARMLYAKDEKDFNEEDDFKEWRADGWKNFELPFRLAITDSDSLNGEHEEEASVRFPVVYGSETLYPEFKIRYRLGKTDDGDVKMNYSIYGMGSRLADKSVVFARSGTGSLALALTLKKSGEFEWSAVESIRIITR